MEVLPASRIHDCAREMCGVAIGIGGCIGGCIEFSIRVRIVRVRLQLSVASVLPGGVQLRVAGVFIGRTWLRVVGRCCVHGAVFALPVDDAAVAPQRCAWRAWVHFTRTIQAGSEQQHGRK
jgi:hypothetical protein